MTAPPAARTGRAGAWLAQHKVGLGVGGAAAVAALAYVRSRSSRSSGPGAGAAAGSTIAQGGQLAGATGYDSTGSDVYNALEPMLEGLSNSLANLSGTIPVPGAAPAGDLSSPTKVPAPTPSTIPVPRPVVRKPPVASSGNPNFLTAVPATWHPEITGATWLPDSSAVGGGISYAATIKDRLLESAKFGNGNGVQAIVNGHTVTYG